MTPPADLRDDQWPPARSEDEWLLMYLRGVSIPKITAVCRVNHEAVRHSIRQREREGVEKYTPDRVTTTFSTSLRGDCFKFLA
jgi:hypothetical protein